MYHPNNTCYPGTAHSLEVPIRFLTPSSGGSVARYRVKAVGRSVCLVHDAEPGITDDAAPHILHPTATQPPIYHTLEEEDWKARIVGGASTRVFFQRQQKWVLTTQALVEEPHVICISVLKLETATDNSSQWHDDARCCSSIHIDLGPLLTFLTRNPDYPTRVAVATIHDTTVEQPNAPSRTLMRTIVKTATFRHEEDSFSVLFVDNKGSILTIQLQWDDAAVMLRPYRDASTTCSDDTSMIRFISMYASQTTFPSSSSSTTTTTKRSAHRISMDDGGTLASSQVDFLDSQRVLLALSPWILLCVHTTTGMVASWSDTLCILGEMDTPTILTFHRPMSSSSSSSDDTVSGRHPSQDLSTTSTFTLGRNSTMASMKKKKQSFNSIFKNASGLLLGKSVVDMFMEQHDQLLQRRKSNRMRIQGAFQYFEEELDDSDYSTSTSTLFPHRGNDNTSVYDAYLDREEDEITSCMAAVSALTVLHGMNTTTDPSLDMYDDHNAPAKAVFTLHSDGTIRIWTMPDPTVTGEETRTHIYPWTMKVLYDSNFIIHESQNTIPILPIPSPHTWSSSSDSVSLSCKLFKTSTDMEQDAETSNLLGSLLKTPKKRLRLDRHEDEYNPCELHYALTVAIQAIHVDMGMNDDPDDDDFSNRHSSPCNLTLFRGQLLDTTKEQNSSHITNS